MKNFVLPSYYVQCDKLILSAMGGSAMGGTLVKTLAEQNSKLPIEIIRDYNLPGYADSKTLVIAVSYSGTTEETLAFVNQALEKNCKIISISSGGELETLSKKHRLPHYKINYGSQPRAALGYSYTAVLAIFGKLGLMEVNEDMIKKTIVQMKNAMKKITPEVETVQNPAKQLAKRILGKIPIIIGAGCMQNVALRYKQDFNENAKSVSYSEIIPEMNHNALAGTEFPQPLAEKIFVILLGSSFDHPRNKTRLEISRQILEKRRIPYEIVQPTPAANPITEQMLSIHFGDFTSYYLALLQNIDPEKIDIVDYFKAELAKESRIRTIIS